jgi:HSP20 family molecular chaperone IbpA
MSNVAIEKVDGKKAGSDSIFKEIDALSERIRRRAFEIFAGHQGGDGFALEDWLNAERELLCSCDADLIEQDGKYQLRMNAPGFAPGDLRITALPDALIVTGESTHTHNKNDGDVQFCEIGEKTLFRRFDLPKSIDPDKVTADLNKGVLHLTAVKAKQVTGQTQKAFAA